MLGKLQDMGSIQRQPTMANELTPTLKGTALRRPRTPTSSGTSTIRSNTAIPFTGPTMNVSPTDHVRRTADRFRDEFAQQPATPTNPNQPAQPTYPQPVATGDPTGQGGNTQFGPGENLIGTQFNLPTTNREELVQRMFGALTPEMDRQAALRREALGRQVAGLGRGGMGGVNTAFGTLEAHEAAQRGELLGRLSADAAGADIEDMFRRANFGQTERAYQNQLDLQGQNSQAALMQALQQLGFSFDPVNNANLTNALVGESDARFRSAQSAAAPWGQLAQAGGMALPSFL